MIPLTAPSFIEGLQPNSLGMFSSVRWGLAIEMLLRSQGSGTKQLPDLMVGCHRLARWSITLVATQRTRPIFAPRSPATATPSLGNGERRGGGRPSVCSNERKYPLGKPVALNAEVISNQVLSQLPLKAAYVRYFMLISHPPLGLPERRFQHAFMIKIYSPK